MSSREPERANKNTGPPHVDTSRTQSEGGWERRFEAPLSVNPRPVHRSRRPVGLLAAATAAVIGLGAVAWLFWPSPKGDEVSGHESSTTTESKSPHEEAQTRLMGMLPGGYGAGCEAVVPAKGALAQISCSENTDAGGPSVASYSLAKDDESLRALFDDVVSTSSVVDYPGKIQSPGPWRRSVTPQQVAGTLVCGFQQGKPTVAWTTDAELMLSEVRSGPQGPTMDQLYTWWASHS